MLTNIDFELFPDDCEVVHMPLHNLWIFLIQKNGSTSLRKLVDLGQGQIIKNHDLKSLTQIDFYLRDPRDRYISGMNTFVKRLLRDRPDLDQDTCVWFANRYLFLNRHYLPQWHWLVNLTRFLNADCQIRFHHVKDLENLTELRLGPKITPPDDSVKKSIREDTVLWYHLDNILQELVGKSMSWTEIKQYYQENHLETWDTVTQRLRSIQHVLS